MPATFSGRRLDRLLPLLLLCISLSGGSPTGPVMTTQDASQSQVNPLTKMQAGLNESSAVSRPSVVPSTCICSILGLNRSFDREQRVSSTQQKIDTIVDSTSLVSIKIRGVIFQQCTKAYVHQCKSDMGPDPTTQDLKQPSKETMSNGSFVQSEILLPGASGTPLERIITLANATTVELSCKLDTNSNLKSPQVTWRRGNETISHTSKTENIWSIRLAVVDNSNMGSYSCILKGEEEISGVFHLQVPNIEARGKFVITYERDAAVLLCKSGSTPMAWTWYMIHGSKQIVINASLQADKYLIDRVSANVTHLRILKITKEDAGVYCCEATFELGKAKLEIELKVLSIMAPLKPFIAVVAEVVVLLTTIILYEVYSKRKEKCTGEKPFDQIEQLKSGESSSSTHGKI